MIAVPYVASPVLPNHGGLVARHALRTPVGQEPVVAKTLQRTVPPNPQIAFAVFKDAPNAVGADFAVIAADRHFPSKHGASAGVKSRRSPTVALYFFLPSS